MSEIKITKNSLENAILKDGNFVSGVIEKDADSIDASGNGAHAEGYGNVIADGDGAHAEGYNTQAFGDGAHAEGKFTKAFADYSHAEGISAQALASYSHAEGQRTYAIAVCTHAEGYNTHAGIIEFGNTNLSPYSGTYKNFQISGGDYRSTFQENDIIKIGNSGNELIIESAEVIAEGDILVTKITTVNGDDRKRIDTTLEIYKKCIEGNYSHAEGYQTNANADYSHSGGYGTIANAEAMTAIGKYNNTSTNAYFVVGNGIESTNRKDAFVVDTSGNVQIGGDITKVSNVSINDNVSIGGTATANVNSINNVYLGCPIGTVVMWAGGDININTWNVSTEAPDGWLVCDGRVIPTNASFNKVSSGYEDFQNLLDVIGTKYGKKHNEQQPLESRQTVNGGKETSGYYVYIPNFTQKFPLGAGYTSEYEPFPQVNHFQFDAGNTTYQSYNGQEGGEAEHTLTWTEMKGHSHRGSTPSTGIATFLGSDGDSRITGPANESGSGESNPHNNIPPYLAINFIIKYK